MASELRLAHPGGSYPIAIEAGALARVGERLVAWGLRPGPAALVSDAQVAAAWAEPVRASLETAGFEAVSCVVPGGEHHKTLGTVSELYAAFLAAGLDRDALVLGLGGGVVGDLSGFAAATYLRGVRWVQLPTSLLAMVDASIGGKTGVDLPQGKNLVGAFKQPEGVLIDPRALDTLPPVELRAGMAEVVKHALIADPALFARLEAEGLATDREALVARAVEVKRAVVEQDPFERGRRAVLNLGHTFAHAFERERTYALRHGEAVAVGLVAAALLAEALGRGERGLAARIAALLERLELPTRLSGLEVDAVYAAMAHDKKRRGRRLRFVIPEALGRVALIDDPGAAQVKAALAQVLGR